MKPRIVKYEGADATNSYCAVLTKEVVDTLLEINTKNRNFKKSNLEMFKSIVANGDWDVGSATIRVNMSWTRLIDGQHKLKELRDAGYPKVAATIVEIPDEYAQRTFLNMDVGAIRTVASAMSLAGCSYNTKFWASLDRAYNSVKTSQSYKSTSASVQRFYEAHSQIVSRAKVTDCKKFGNSSAVSALIVFCEHEKDLVDEAINGYIEADDGVMLAPNDAKYHLNRFLYGSHGTSRNAIFFKVLKSIWLYTHHTNVSFLRIEDKDVDFFSERYSLCVKSLNSRSV